MVETSSCPRCGRAITGQDTFCGACGTRVTAASAGTQVGVQLGDDDDLILAKLRESTVGEYEVRGLLGRGGMASVFVAYDLALNRRVAIKAMHPGLLGDSGMRERFRLEARLAARLDHPNIVTVHAVKERATLVFFDLKLIDGAALDRLLRHRAAPLDVRVARWLTAKIADALHYAHTQGIVHRDVKPANVMIERRGDPIVTDFGIAKATESPHLTMTGAVVGTPAYMSPEQCLGTEITAASDQYSLGILAYEMLTGTVPFSGSMLTIQLGHVEKVPAPPHAVNTAVPQPASDVVMRMLAKNPADRWPSLAEASDALMDSLAATDAQMRRELAALVAALPLDVSRPSLPATPRSPTPATVSPGATMPIIPAPRADDAATEMVMPRAKLAPTPVLGFDVVDGEESHDIGTHARPSAPSRRRIAPLAGAGVVIVAVAGIFMSQRGGDDTATVTPPPPAPAPESAVVTAPPPAGLDASLDASDTVVARIGVEPLNVSIELGDSLRLVATAYGPSGETIARPVTWTSSDTIRVRVRSDGLIRARALGGPVFLTARAAGKSNFAIVTVK